MPKVQMPQLGESVAEGTIGKWLKKPGDHVDKYEPIVEVITDKVNAEVPSPYEGTLTEILVQEGETVPNNTEIAVIEAAGEAAEATEHAAPPPPRTSAAAPAAPVAAAEASVDETASQAGGQRPGRLGRTTRAQHRAAHRAAGRSRRPPPPSRHRRRFRAATARPVRTATRARPRLPCAGWRASTESTWRWSPASAMAAG